MQKRKKIAVNTRFLIKGKLEGIGYFTNEILKELVLQHSEIDFYFLFDRNFDSEYIFAKNITAVNLFPPARHPFLWFLWFEFSVAYWLYNNKPDLFLSMDGYTSLNSDIPKVTVVHDLAFEHFPNHVGRLVRAYYKYFTPKFIAASKKVVAVSEYTKSDIQKQYDTDPNKIEIVYNVANPCYTPIDESEQQHIKNEYFNGNDYFVYVGAIHPRKNISGLLQAFEHFKNENSNSTKLILVGRKAWQYGDIDQTFENMKHKSDVIFLGHLPSAITSKIVASSLALCYVSLFEGFGIPIIEAQQAGTAVITSSTSSMPEVAGNAAIIVNPENHTEVATAMQKIFSDTGFRQQLIELGTENCKRFSRQQSAKALWKIIESCL